MSDECRFYKKKFNWFVFVDIWSLICKNYFKISILKTSDIHLPAHFHIQKGVCRW